MNERKTSMIAAICLTGVLVFGPAVSLAQATTFSGILSSGGTATSTPNWQELANRAAALGFPLPSAF